MLLLAGSAWEASLGVAAMLGVPGMTGNAVLQVGAIFMGSWVPYTGREQPTADSESVATRLRAVSTNRKWLKIVNFCQEQKLGYLSSCWMNLLQIFTDCALNVYLLVAKTLRGDVKDFWRYSTFSDGRKSAIFVRFSAEKQCFLASR